MKRIFAYTTILSLTLLLASCGSNTPTETTAPDAPLPPPTEEIAL